MDERFFVKIGTDGRTMKVPVDPMAPVNTQIYHDIGCDIFELVSCRRISSRWIMAVDEEGKLKKAPVLNLVASWIYGSLDHWQMIVGDALIMKEVEGPDGGVLMPLTDQEAEQVLKDIGAFLGNTFARIDKAIGEVMS